MAIQATLIILRDGEIIKTVTVQDEILLGRAEDCGIRLNEKAVSRQHAVVRPVGNSYQIEAKSEFAPLSINGAEISRAILKDGDVISIGPFLIRVSLNAETEKLSEPASVESATSEEQGASEAAEESFKPEENSESSELQMESADSEFSSSESLESNSSSEASFETAENGSETSIEMESSEPFVPADEDGRTTFTSVAKMSVQLIFKPGDANVTVYELTKDETSIGRGKSCDIVLNDKKSSRQNSIIRRAGISFSIKDLDSSNGTYVNGVRIEEQELTGDDVIKIGDVEFQFRALSADYVAKEKNFMSLPAEVEQESEESSDSLMLDSDPMNAEMNSDHMANGTPESPNFAAENVGPIPGAFGQPTGMMTGMGGIGGTSNKKLTLTEKFRALPKRTQMIAVVAVILFLMWFMEDDEAPIKKKFKSGKARNPAATAKKDEKGGAAADKGPATFDSLTPEQKRFVEAQHNLAFDYYKNKEYDKALFEIQKIFALVQDYKDAKEIERYAKEGKRKTEAIEEERRKKEEETKLKSKIAVLVEEARERMSKKDFIQGRELFTQILALDPDNTMVTNWNKEIEAFEEEQRVQKQQKQVQIDINKQGWNIYTEAMGYKKQGKFYTAIATFQKVMDIGSSDPKLIRLAKKMIGNSKFQIKNRRDPILNEAKQAEEAGELTKAFSLYKRATQVDSRHPAGYAGMSRIKKILHERAKSIYTEAIIAESYSDFDGAQKKFQEIIEVTPSDDLYYERAQRKLGHYFKPEAKPAEQQGQAQEQPQGAPQQ
jgi:pSer/pThr/pTyr-binding forkhead associated (FHA) protein/tetratricopeptide (TPR) repeat protein